MMLNTFFYFWDKLMCIIKLKTLKFSKSSLYLLGNGINYNLIETILICITLDDNKTEKTVWDEIPRNSMAMLFIIYALIFLFNFTKRVTPTSTTYYLQCSKIQTNDDFFFYEHLNLKND